MLRRVSLLAMVTVAGCASATVNGGDDDNVDAARIDAPPGAVDAPPGVIDAPPVPIDAPAIQTITLTQGTTNLVDGTIGCFNSTFGYTTENSYYRAFRLTDFGVTRQFTANRIDVGIESATAGSGASQAIQVKLYTVSGAFPAGVMTQIAGQIVNVNNTGATGTVLSVTLSPTGVAPAGSTIVAEVFVPDGVAAANTLVVGSNGDAETAPSYIRAPSCGSTQPATLASLGYGTVHIVLTVTGTY